MAAYQIPDTALSDRVRALVERDGMSATARRLDMSEATIARVVGRLRVAAGTLALVASLTAEQEARP